MAPTRDTGVDNREMIRAEQREREREPRGRGGRRLARSALLSCLRIYYTGFCSVTFVMPVTPVSSATPVASVSAVVPVT